MMKAVKGRFLGIKKFPMVKIDPHFILLLLVIVFFVLLFAAENVVKVTIIQ